MGMCHGNIEEYLDKSTAQTIASFISSHTKAIANSAKKQMATASVGVTSENTGFHVKLWYSCFGSAAPL